MLEEEVFVAPGLEHLVVGRIHAVAGALEGAVEVLGVLQEGVVGGEVGTAAEPPHRAGLEIAIVEVNGGDVGVAGMQHHRGAGGEPAVTLGLGPLAEDGGRQLTALHLGEVHAALLEHPAGLHHPRTAAAPLGPLPALLGKAAIAIELLKPGADGILQTHQQGLGPLARVGRRGFQGLEHQHRAPGAPETPSPFQAAGPAHKRSRGSVMPAASDCHP